MASIIFMHRMSREIEIETDEQVLEEDGGGRDLTQVLHEKGVMSLRLSGPLFFGWASQVSHFFQKIGEAPKVLILRMGYVPVVDATGANIIIEFIKKVKKYDTKIHSFQRQETAAARSAQRFSERRNRLSPPFPLPLLSKTR